MFEDTNLLPAREITTSKDIFEITSRWHDEFDMRVWQGKESFHNSEHRKTLSEARKKLSDAAKAGKDPLHIKRDLGVWNTNNPNAKVTLEELDEVFEIHEAAHDLGNVADVLVDNMGTLKPHFLDKYTANGAEDRSKEMVKILIERSTLDDDKKTRYLPLVLHMIEQTKYKPGKNEGSLPFSISVPFLDQVAGELFRDNPSRAVEGLRQEWVGENQTAQNNPSYMINFARNRYKDFLTESQMAEVLVICGKKMPDEVEGYANEKMPLSKVKFSYN